MARRHAIPVLICNIPRMGFIVPVFAVALMVWCRSSIRSFISVQQQKINLRLMAYPTHSRRFLFVLGFSVLPDQARATITDNVGLYNAKESERERIRKNSEAARANYEAVVTEVCRVAEALAQQVRQMKGSRPFMAEEVRSFARILLYNQDLEVRMTNAEVLVGAKGAAKRRALAIEALESVVNGLRDGPLEGPRRGRVMARLRLAEQQVLEYTDCLPRASVFAAEKAVELENAANAPEFAGIFPWRSASKEGCPERGQEGRKGFFGSSALLNEMER